MLELVVIAELLPNRYVSQSKDAHFDLPCNMSHSWYQCQIELVQASVLNTVKAVPGRVACVQSLGR